MKTIKYRKLYNYLKEEVNFSLSERIRTIWRIRQLSNDFKEVVYEVVEGRAYNVADFAVHGITFRALVEEEQMNLIQAIFFLDWLKKEPDMASIFMSYGRLRSVQQPLDEDNNTKIKDALERYYKNIGNESTETEMQHNDETDILIDNGSQK